MHTLRDALAQAQKSGVAIGHFNVGDLALLKAVFSSAYELQVPVLVGVSEGERDFVGVCQIAALVRSLREEFDFPIFLNADHTHSLPKAIEAAQSGFDAIVFDRQYYLAVQVLKAHNDHLRLSVLHGVADGFLSDAIKVRRSGSVLQKDRLWTFKRAAYPKQIRRVQRQCVER